MKLLNLQLIKNINYKEVFDNLLLIIIIYVLLRYSLDFKVIYPEFLLELNEYYIFKIFLYLLLFIISNYNITYGLLYFIFLLFLEFDNMLFMKEN
jgi:hypothetical protein|tara:strand:+ start:1891 stop:2175 length:285 start_codon:yes stop_codon:yes gene_type:complete